MDIKEALEILNEAQRLAPGITSRLQEVINLGKGNSRSFLLRKVTDTLDNGEFENREQLAIDSFLGFLIDEMRKDS